MRNPARSVRLMAWASLLVLSACSSGGGGGSSAALTPSPSTPALPIQAAGRATLGPNTAIQQSAANALFTPAGTAFPLQQSVIVSTGTTAAAATSVNNGGATLTYNGTTGTGANMTQLYELKIPGLGVDAVVPYNSASTVMSNGFTVGIGGGLLLNYLAIANWQAISGNTTYTSLGLTGLQTPISSVPTTGQGTFMTNGRTGPVSLVQGSLFYTDSGNLVQVGGIFGSATVTVNFGTSAVTGTMSLVAAAAGSTGQAPPWNGVSLSGTLSGANISGTTAVTSTPAGSLTFDASSTGTFDGALYGPGGAELGAIWSLHDTTGQGKTAVGVIAAEKQN